MRTLIVVVFLAVLGAGGAYVWAGQAAGPAIQIVNPAKFAGASTPFEVLVDAPGRRLTSLRIAFEQNGVETPLVTVGAAADVTPTGGASQAKVTEEGTDRTRVAGLVGRQQVPGLKSGAARLVVTAVRPVLFGLREAAMTATRDIRVRLEPPRTSVLSTHHYVNQGGSEMVVYRAEPTDVQSGVIVGDVEYAGYPASGITIEGVHITDPAIRVCFFALLYNQDLGTKIRLFARDEAGNETQADLDFRAFPKPFKTSRIDLDDKFLDRVVPAILAGTTEIAPAGSTIDRYIAINGDLRRKNAEKIASFAKGSAPELIWGAVPFHQFANTKVEAAFADQRTYLYKGAEVDHQVHLGFDLASFAATPIVAANRGKVVFAEMLGIYGNAVIIDHGMGVQSLYAHLSVLEVKPGASVEKDQQIGRSGITGLAAGDHLHFTMLVGGHMVNPIEWWDPHWVQDRIVRKLKDAR